MMDAICEKGRKQVKGLLEKVIGKKIEAAKEPVILRNGDVYKCDNYIPMAVVSSEDGKEKVLVGLQDPNSYTAPSVSHMVTSTTASTMEWITGRNMKRIGRFSHTINPL